MEQTQVCYDKIQIAKKLREQESSHLKQVTELREELNQKTNQLQILEQQKKESLLNQINTTLTGQLSEKEASIKDLQKQVLELKKKLISQKYNGKGKVHSSQLNILDRKLSMSGNKNSAFLEEEMNQRRMSQKFGHQNTTQSLFSLQYQLSETTMTKTASCNTFKDELLNVIQRLRNEKSGLDKKLIEIKERTIEVLVEKESMINILNETNEQLETEKRELEEQLNEIKGKGIDEIENENLKQQIIQLKQSLYVGKENYFVTIEELENQNIQLLESNKQLEKQINQLDEENNYLKTELSEQNNQNQQNEDKILKILDFSQEKEVDLENKLKKKTKQLMQKEQEIKEQMAYHKVALEKVQFNNQELNKKVLDQEKFIEEVDKQTKALQNEIKYINESLNKEQQKCNQYKEQLNQTLMQCDMLKHKHEEQEKNLQLSFMQIREVELERDDLYRKLQEQGMMNESQLEVLEKGDQLVKIEELEVELGLQMDFTSEQIEIINELRERIEQMEQDEKNLVEQLKKEHKLEIQQLKTNLNGLQQEYDQFKANMLKVADQSEQNQQQSQIVQENKSLKQEINELQVNLLSQISRFSHTLNELTSDIQYYKEINFNLKFKKQNLKLKIKVFEKQIKRLVEFLKTMKLKKAKVTQLNELINKLNEENKEN